MSLIETLRAIHRGQQARGFHGRDGEEIDADLRASRDEKEEVVGYHISAGQRGWTFVPASLLGLLLTSPVAATSGELPPVAPHSRAAGRLDTVRPVATRPFRISTATVLILDGQVVTAAVFLAAPLVVTGLQLAADGETVLRIEARRK